MATKLTEITANLHDPFYETGDGSAYLGDSRELMARLPDESVNLIVTSPPFALRRKKEYGNVDASEYVEWFRPFAREMWRVLDQSGSLVIHIGSSWNKGVPTKSLYHYKLIIDLCETFHLAQEFFWFNPAKLPSPAEWVTVRRIRAKDAVDYVWWLSKDVNPKADNRQVLQQYSTSMQQLLKRGYKPNKRPSGHEISDKFQKHNNGSIPPNILNIANTDSNGYYLRSCRKANLAPHPARYPIELPGFFIKFLTDPGDIVLDPFGGSNVTGLAAEQLGRKWLTFEINQDYLEGSKFRFERVQKIMMSEDSTPYGDAEQIGAS